MDRNGTRYDPDSDIMDFNSDNDSGSETNLTTCTKQIKRETNEKEESDDDGVEIESEDDTDISVRSDNKEWLGTGTSDESSTEGQDLERKSTDEKRRRKWTNHTANLFKNEEEQKIFRALPFNLQQLNAPTRRRSQVEIMNVRCTRTRDYNYKVHSKPQRRNSNTHKTKDGEAFQSIGVRAHPKSKQRTPTALETYKPTNEVEEPILSFVKGPPDEECESDVKLPNWPPKVSAKAGWRMGFSMATCTKWKRDETLPDGLDEIVRENPSVSVTPITPVAKPHPPSPAETPTKRTFNWVTVTRESSDKPRRPVRLLTNDVFRSGHRNGLGDRDQRPHSAVASKTRSPRW